MKDEDQGHGKITGTLITGQLGIFRGLFQNLEEHLFSIVQEKSLLRIVRLENTFCSGPIVAHAGGLPTGIIAGRICAIQLEATNGVPAGNQKGTPKGTIATMLGDVMLMVTEGLDEELNRNGLIIGELMTLAGQPRLVDQQIGVCCDTRNDADYITRSR